jgi:hypothetical protein
MFFRFLQFRVKGGKVLKLKVYIAIGTTIPHVLKGELHREIGSAGLICADADGVFVSLFA